MKKKKFIKILFFKSNLKLNCIKKFQYNTVDLAGSKVI